MKPAASSRHDEGLPRVPVAVNLSAIEFRQRDVVGEIAQVLQSAGLAPQYLEVEITESALMQADYRTTPRPCRPWALLDGGRLRHGLLGSLAYLKRAVPLMLKIKVDRSFVTDTPADSEDVAIVTAIIQLAHSLQLQPAVPKVETAEPALLQRLGCELAQGFGIAPPMDAQRAPASGCAPRPRSGRTPGAVPTLTAAWTIGGVDNRHHGSDPCTSRSHLPRDRDRGTGPGAAHRPAAADHHLRSAMQRSQRETPAAPVRAFIPVRVQTSTVARAHAPGLWLVEGPGATRPRSAAA